MMYQIIIKKKAKKFIDKLPINERQRVVSAIGQLPNGEASQNQYSRISQFLMPNAEYSPFSIS